MKDSLTKILLFFILLSCNDQTPNAKNINDPERKSSVIIYLSNTNQIELSICTASQVNDSLVFTLTDSLSLYTLTVIKVNQTILSELKQQFSVADSPYKKPVFTPITQAIKLENPTYRRSGDKIKGYANFKFSELNTWKEIHTDTVIVQGLIYATLR
jgi:hypothetical protein